MLLCELQGDTGAAVVFFAMFVVMSLAAHVKLRYFAVLGGLVLTFMQQPMLALVQLTVSLLTFLTITLVTRRGIPFYTQAQQAVDTVVRILRENASGVRVIKALACQGRERERFEAANHASRRAEEQAAG